MMTKFQSFISLLYSFFLCLFFVIGPLSSFFARCHHILLVCLNDETIKKREDKNCLEAACLSIVVVVA